MYSTVSSCQTKIANKAGLILRKARCGFLIDLEKASKNTFSPCCEKFKKSRLFDLSLCMKQVKRGYPSLHCMPGQIHSYFNAQAKETKMKSKLDSLASYAMIPHGFQRHKGRIVRLAEDCLEIARDGEPSSKDVATRFVSTSFHLARSALQGCFEPCTS